MSLENNNEINKVKCKLYHTSLGEKFLLFDGETEEQDISFYKWKREINELALKNKLGIYFTRPDTIVQDKRPYLENQTNLYSVVSSHGEYKLVNSSKRDLLARVEQTQNLTTVNLEAH